MGLSKYFHAPISIKKFALCIAKMLRNISILLHYLYPSFLTSALIVEPGLECVELVSSAHPELETASTRITYHLRCRGDRLWLPAPQLDLPQ